MDKDKNGACIDVNAGSGWYRDLVVVMISPRRVAANKKARDLGLCIPNK